MYCSVLSKMPSAALVANSSAPKAKLSHQSTASTTKATAHYTQNARLHAVFDQSGDSARSFSYSQPLPFTTEQQIPEATLIQPFGSTIVVDQSSFRVLAYSENAQQMLQTFSLGTDVRSLFTHSTALLLENAFAARQINPILIHSRNSGEPFHAILHRIDAGIVIDLEPAVSISGVGHSPPQSLPGGDPWLLCDTVREMTGYDRVMVYKFHEDNHGEVVAESKRPDLEAFIGLHFPATDIPEASRVSFKRNRVRMIVDCHASGVRMVQDEGLEEPVCLVGSTLRAPSGCHVQYMANMGSIATLVMAVLVGGESCTKLWGLVICHHGSPRSIPFPLRRACDSLVQDFGERLNVDKRVLRAQTPFFPFPVKDDAVFGEVSLLVRESSDLCFR